jgi:CRP/FNR family cyclic AMP-dependent transcriptional regulator
MPNATLPRLGILAFMDDDYRIALAGYGRELATEPKQVLLKEGVDSRTLYIVLAGTFIVSVNSAGGQSTLDTVGVGDCLGEISLFEPGAASATATSAEKGKLWAIDSDALQRFLQDYPLAGCALVLGINTLLSRRLRKATSVIKVGEIVPTFLSVRSRHRMRA